MMESIKQFFFQHIAAPEEAEPDGCAPRPEDLRLAACALLLELAYADNKFSETERAHLEGAIRREFGLDEAEAEELIRLAEKERETAVDLWSFTNLIADHFSLGQKMVLAEAMWGLVYADGELGSREDYLMRKISGLLRLEPGYLSEARNRMRDHPPEDLGEKQGDD